MGPTDRDLPEVVYTPGSALRRPGELVGRMLRDLWASRQLARRLFIRDLRAQYRKSLLGYVWLLLPPVVTTLLFVFLHSHNILNIGRTDVPYPVYVLTGMVLWETFVLSLNSPIGMISGATSMLTKLNFPREALILCAFYRVLFNFSIKLLLLLGVLVWFGIPLPLTLLVAPLGILSIIALGFTLGLLLVPWGLLYQDVGRALAVFTRIWFFATPVIYPPPASWPARLVNDLNPVSPVLVSTREMLTTGRLSQLPGFLAVASASVLLLCVGWLLYRLAMPHLIARMNA